MQHEKSSNKKLKDASKKPLKDVSQAEIEEIKDTYQKKFTSSSLYGHVPLTKRITKRLSPLAENSKMVVPSQKRTRLKRMKKSAWSSTSGNFTETHRLCTSKVAKEINHPSVEENVGKSHKNSVCISEGKSSHRSFSRDSIIAETSSVASTKNEKKLLSSIQALKNELTAKNDLIDQKEADKANCEGVISSMKEEFTCVICNELFINAHSLICSHLFCEFCIKKWMSSEHMECPICRVRITTQPACSSVLNNAVSKLEVKLRAEELQERTKMKEEHKARLLEISKVSFPSAISEAYNSEYSISSESESDDYDSERDSYDSEYDDFSSFDSMDQTEDYNSVSSSDLHDISFPDIGSDVHDSSDSSFTSSDSHESEDTSFGGCSQASALSKPSDASSTTGYGCVSSHRLLSDDTETETEMENVYNHSRDSISRNFSVVNPDLMHCHSNFHDDLEQESSDSRYFSCSEGESGCTR